WTDEVSAMGGIGQASAAAVVEWHGRRSLEIAHMARSSAEMRAPLCPHTEHIVAEAAYAFASECATTLGDVLLRRVPVALGACWWLRANRSFPTKLQDEPRLGLRLAPRRSWYFGTRRFATCPVPLPRSTLGGFLFRAPRCLP